MSPYRVGKGGGLHGDVRLQEHAGTGQGGLQRARQLLLLMLVLIGATAAATVAAAAVRVRLLGNGAQRKVRVVVARTAR